MQKGPGVTVDTKLVAVLIIVCLALGGSFALIYTNLKADIVSLQNSNANLSSEVDQLRRSFEEQHTNMTGSLTAVEIYNNTEPSVVLITNDRTDGSTDEGTGFVYDTQGHIITNNHVIDGYASITVTFFDGSVETAQLTGTDVYSDLALVKVGNLPNQSRPLIIGNSSQLMVGEPVYAIGNPFGLSSSMTSGIVSQLGRVLKLSDLGAPQPWGNYSIADIVQFDAAVNPGNSGGPLLNSQGWVIGVTFAIETGQTGVSGFIGIGYAVPSVLLMRVIPALNSAGHHYYHPYVGIEYDPSYTDGVHIASVITGGPAYNAGLQSGDVIKEVDSLPINTGDDFIIYLEIYKSPGDTLNLKINRGGTSLNLALTLGERPS